MNLIRNIVIVILIAATQLGSLGFLLNRHFCKDQLKEVSVLLANQSCTKDLTFSERLLYLVDDCENSEKSDGLSKAPCCTYESIFSKISVFQEDVSTWELSTTVALIHQDVFHLEVPFESYHASLDLHPPPLLKRDFHKQFCIFLI